LLNKYLKEPIFKRLLTFEDILIRMKKYYAFIIACLLVLSSAVAQPPVSQPKKLIADKIIAVVGDKIVLKSDIDNSIIDMQRQNIEIPANGRCMVLEQAMGIKALVLQAEKDSLPVTDEEVEKIEKNSGRCLSDPVER